MLAYPFVHGSGHHPAQIQTLLIYRWRPLNKATKTTGFHRRRPARCSCVIHADAAAKLLTPPSGMRFSEGQLRVPVHPSSRRQDRGHISSCMGMAALLREPLKFQSVDRFLGPRTTGRVKFTSAHSSTDVAKQWSWWAWSAIACSLVP
jgi:hypothetical protein